MSPRNASDIQPDKNISILLKSPPGYGKTLAAVSLALYGEVWLAYFDKQVPIEIFTYLKERWPHVLNNIKYDTYTAATANKYINDLGNICEREKGRYIGLITDSVTTMTTAAINWSMSFRGTKDDIPNTLDGSSKMIPGFDDYKVETNYAAQALDLTSSYPGFNIWTAHPLVSLDMKGGDGNKITAISTKQSLVSYGNKVGQLVPGRFQEIYHLARQGSKRVVWTDAVGDDYAKTSYRGMPKMIDITDQLFFELWKAEVNKCMGVYNEVKTDSNVITTDKWKV